MSLGEGRERLRSMAHPVRVRILSLLTGTPATAAEVARELGITHANASYHLRNLLHGGLIEVAGEERIRGGVAKRYRHVPELPAPDRPRQDHRLVFEAFAQELRRRAGDHLVTDLQLAADAELWVDPQVWADVHRRITEAVHDLHLAARPPRTPGTFHTSTTVALFRMPDR